MVNEAVQNYVNLVSGLTKTTRAKAVAGARSLLAQAGLDDVASDAGARTSKLADDIVSASKANRQLMRTLIGSEVDQMVGKLGFARVEELERLRAEVRDLQETVRGRGSSEPTTADDIPARNAAARKAATKKTPAKRAAARTTPARRTATKKTSARKAAAQPPAAAASQASDSSDG